MNQNPADVMLQVKLWAINDSGASAKPISTLAFADAATSVSLRIDGGRHVLAVGLESGAISIYFAALSKASAWTECLTLSGQ